MTAMDMLDLAVEPPPGGKVLHASDRATIIWGDCRDPQIIASVPRGYGLLATDPPYGIGYRSNWSKQFDQLAGDDGSVDWPAVLGEWVGPDGTQSVGMADKRHVMVFGYDADTLAQPLRLSATIELIWDKVIPGSGDVASVWATSHEPITFGVHFKRPSDRNAGRGALTARLRRGSVIRWPRPSGVLRHPTEKPWQVMAQLIESSSVFGDLVVDPCAGSGSTGVAAVLEGRRCFLVEYKREFAELAVRRVQAAERLAAQMEAA
ncbi:DNA methyltransferase [Streptomyces sp. NPDC051104]|uniref:DNA-methyltransferase n=1 Tax=Streptomyces sp. NPDC051104 TaxID=3155044 RepID=UPI003414417F